MEITRENLLALIQSGLKRDGLSISGLERDARIPKDTIRDFLRGKTQILRADKLQKVLRVLEPQDRVRVSGHVGAGARIVYTEPTAASNQDLVECPPGCDPCDVVAIRIKGNEMLPVFQDGWVVYYNRRHDLPIPVISGGWQVPYNKKDKENADPLAEFIGKPGIIGLADGRAYLGTLKAHAGNKHYSITNYNASDIPNILPVWAAKIVFIKT